MATIKKTNIYNYLKAKFSNTASHIKMNGPQSAGSSDLMARADHVHPTDTSRAPTSHNHGNLLNNGQVGSTVQADKPLITDSNGKIKIGIFGNGAKTFCEGNDPRLSDKRNPTTNFIDASSTNPVDLNAIREIGFYCTMSNTGAQYVSNCPYSSTGSAPFTNNKMFYLLVESLGNGSNKPFVKQTLTYHNSNNVWVRTKNGGDADDANWSSWEKISLEGHTHQLNDVGLTKIEANADFETYKQQGFYYIDNTNAQSCDNMPFKTGGLLIVRNLVGGVSQTFQRYNGTDMWYKTYSNGEDQWSNWNKICFADHTHGNLQNNGQVGSTVQADKPLITDSNGKIKIGIFGNGAKTFCEGNDPRLSDKRNPTTNFIDASSTNPVDLNAFREIGFYCTMSNTGAQYVSNCPYSSTGSAPFTNNKMFYLLVESLGNGSNKPFVKQTLTYHNSNNVWVRTKNGGDADDANWSSWENISVGLTKIGANADFETYKQQGFYYIDNTNAQSCDNMPFKTGGLLIVRNLVGGVSQTFQRYNGTDMWYKTYSNGEDQWSNWNKICFADHTHGNIQSGGTIGSDANKPLITTTSGKITTGSFGNGAKTFCEGNDSRITNAVNSACKMGFALAGASTIPSNSLEFNVNSGGLLYAYVRDANGNIPANITKGYMVVNGSFQSKTVHSATGSIYAQMNVNATFLVEAGFMDANGWIVCSATCKVTVS